MRPQTAPTQLEVSHAPAHQDTSEMDSTVWVSKKSALDTRYFKKVSHILNNQ